MAEKTKLYAVSSLDIHDFESHQCVIGVFSTLEKAQKRMNEAFEDFKRENAEDIEDGWVVEEANLSCEAYEDGRSAENSYSLVITTVELDQ